MAGEAPEFAAQAPESGLARRNVLLHVGGRLLGFELALVPPVVAVWLVLEVVDLGAVLLLTALRIAATMVLLRGWLAPARAWQTAGPSPDDRVLTTADRCLQRLHRRLASSIWLGWSLVLALASMLETSEVGDAERLVAALIVVALCTASTGLAKLLLQATLIPIRIAIGRQLLDRGLRPDRSRTTLEATIAGNNFTTLLGTLLGVGALTGMIRIDRIRAVAESDLLREVAVLAATANVESNPLDTLEADPAGPPISVLPPEGLPPALAKPAADAEPSAARSAYDRRAAIAFAAAPLDDGRWIVGERDVDEELGLLLLALGFLLVTAAAPGLYVSKVFSRGLAQQIEAVSAAARRFVVHGELRDVARVVPLRNDETGELAESFNAMLDILDELAAAASAVAGGDLRVRLDRPGELHDAFRGMLKRIDAMVGSIRATALDMAGAAVEIQAITQAQESSAEEQAAAMREVSMTVASLAEGAEDITIAAADVLENAERTSKMTDAMVAKIGELSGQANRIGDLLEHIRDIADRSDLLALNGSLEATRAGEAGRGFALVAAEMRRLAERVTGTVADVREHMTQIKASSASTVMTTEESRRLAESTARSARKISAVTEQQGIDTEQVAISFHNIAERVGSAASALGQTRAAIEGLRARADELEQLTSEFDGEHETRPADRR